MAEYESRYVVQVCTIDSDGNLFFFVHGKKNTVSKNSVGFPPSLMYKTHSACLGAMTRLKRFYPKGTVLKSKRIYVFSDCEVPSQ